VKLLVFSNPHPGRDEDFNDWYDQVHMKDLLDIPGVVGAQRYKLHPTGAPNEPVQRYLTIYEIEGAIEPVLGELGARAGTERMVISDALDPSSALMGAFEEA
jgi:hypothetical protein